MIRTIGLLLSASREAWQLVVFAAGCAAVATALQLGLTWDQVVRGPVPTGATHWMVALLAAPVVGLVLSVVDKRITRQVFHRMGLRSSQASPGAYGRPSPSSTTRFPWFALGALIFATIGEEGLRIGSATLLHYLLALDWPLVFVIVGLVFGFAHVTYGWHVVPAKLLDSVVLALGLLFLGLPWAVLAHLALNLGLVLRVKVRTRRL